MSGVYTPLGEVTIPFDYECVDAVYIHPSEGMALFIDFE